MLVIAPRALIQFPKARGGRGAASSKGARISFINLFVFKTNQLQHKNS